MIVSHRHKFIFIHLGRTGGRSLTVALARHSGRKEVITETADLPGRNAEGFGRHDPARKIRAKVGELRFWRASSDQRHRSSRAAAGRRLSVPRLHAAGFLAA